MKHKLIFNLLVGALFLEAVFAALFSIQYVRNVTLIQNLQNQRAKVNREMAIFQSLVNEAVEYRKKNSSIDVVLQALNSTTNTPSQNVQSGKPLIK
jgi:hypothetical protein